MPVSEGSPAHAYANFRGEPCPHLHQSPRGALPTPTPIFEGSPAYAGSEGSHSCALSQEFASSKHCAEKAPTRKRGCCGEDWRKPPIDGAGSQLAPHTCRRAARQPGIKGDCQLLLIAGSLTDDCRRLLVVSWLMFVVLLSFGVTIRVSVTEFATFSWHNRGIELVWILWFNTALFSSSRSFSSVFPSTTNKGCFCAARCPGVWINMNISWSCYNWKCHWDKADFMSLFSWLSIMGSIIVILNRFVFSEKNWQLS